MTDPISLEDFVKSVSVSALFSGLDLRAEIRPNGRFADVSDARDLARRLVDDGRLTPFQAEEILNNRLPQLFVDNYTIQSRIGSGGMGTVFKARHRRMNRVVALKILSPAASGQADLALRFQREVETIAKLSHPNIVMAHDAGESGSGLYLVMEFVDGRDLAAEVAQGGPLSLADAVDCILQAARGLACAHNNGIVHRDIKPANLLRDAGGVVKVADLGLVRLSGPESNGVNASMTQAGNLLGTPDYMAPEQAMDSATVDHRVDIYSLGCTLFFLLAGRPAYLAGSLMALLLKHRDAPIPSLREARADAPAALDDLYQRMVAKTPDDRVATMDEVVTALEQIKRTVPLSDVRPAPGSSPPGATSGTDLTVAADFGRPMDSNVAVSDVIPSLEAAPTSSAVRRVSDLTVVLVEPSNFQAKITQRFLRALHIETILTTGSGRHALELARREGTSLVFSSMHLEDMTGLQLAQALHDDPRYSGVGFVLASTESDSLATCKVFDAPLTLLLPKPFDLQRLAQALAQATGRVVEEIVG
jgi:serine/threonine protein kinase